MQRKISARLSRKLAYLAAMTAGLVPAVSAMAGTDAASATNYAVTISASGSTALRNFTESVGILTVDQSNLVLSNGTYGVGSQFAPTTYVAGSTVGAVNGAAGGPGVRFEWHEQGSVEGILELAQDQLGLTSALNVVTLGARSATSSNPVWINGNVSGNVNKFTSAGTLGNHVLGTFSSVQPAIPASGASITYPVTYTGQNLVQLGMSDVHTTQAFAVNGTASAFAQPGTAGYGLGNPNLAASNGSLGNANYSYQLVNQTALNGPGTTTYAGGTQGTAMFINKAVAQTGTLLVANPGTGLTRLNLTDNQFLQTTSRLANGAEYNMSTRDVNSGTHNTAAVNSGLDPSWTVGKDDNGNTLATGTVANPNGGTWNAADAQGLIGFNTNGPTIHFSNKTAGGVLRSTVQNNRMAVGTLSLPDSLSSVKNNSSLTPLRGLDLASSAADPVTNNNPATPALGAGNVVTPGQWGRASLRNLVTGGYLITQTETYVTIQDPSRAAGLSLGDPNNDVLAFQNNVLNSAAAFPVGGVNSPAISLLTNGYVLPKLMLAVRSNGLDGGTFVANPTPQNALVYAGGGGTGTVDAPAANTMLADPTMVNSFAVADPSTVTTGGAGATYGNAKAGNTTEVFNGGAVNITNQNYLFGNFNQNGTRDLSAVKTALTAAKALDATGNNGLYGAAGSNAQVVATGVTALDTMTNQQGGVGATRGDLVVLGDMNGSGKLDGANLYAMAHGAAVSDATGAGFTNGTLTAASGATLGDQLRNGVLRKNAAMDYMQTNTADALNGGTAAQQTSYNIRVAAAQSKSALSAANDPTGKNAFNKFDVNADGTVNIHDAKIVATMGAAHAGAGLNGASLNDQLSGSTVFTGATAGLPSLPAGQTRSIRIYDAIFTDGNTTVNADYTNPNSDLRQVQSQILGDFNGDGVVNALDINAFILALSNSASWAATYFPNSNITGADAWLVGDFLHNGTFNALDINPFITKLSTGVGASIDPGQLAALQALAVPEPASFAVLALGGMLLLGRRGNRKNA